MTKLVTIKATYDNMIAYLNHCPSTVDYEYLRSGKALNQKDYAKVEAITEFYLRNDCYPVFILKDRDSRPLVGEATVDLDMFKGGQPRFTMKSVLEK